MNHKISYNPSRYHLTFKKMICDHYEIQLDEISKEKLGKGYDSIYEDELKPIVPKFVEMINKEINSKPIKLITFSKQFLDGKLKSSPYDFLLENGKTLSLRCCGIKGKIAPRTIGQAGYKVLNEYFSDFNDHYNIQNQNQCLVLKKLD